MLDFINNFLYSLISFVAGLIFMKYIIIRDNSKISIQLIVLMIFSSIVTSLLFQLDFSMIKTVLFCISYFLMFKMYFKIDGYKALLYALVFVVLLAVSEIIVFLILTKVIDVGTTYLYDVFAVSFLSNIIINIGAILLGYINRKWLIKILNLKFNNYIVIYSMLLFLCVAFFFYLTFININNGIGMFSGIALITILLFFIVNQLVQSYKNNQLMIKYDKLLEFIKKYEVEIDNQRMMRHEIKNQLLTIKSKIVDKDKDKNIINYIDEIIADNNRIIKHAEYAKLNYLPPNGIKGLFYFKVNEAMEKNIDVKINVSKQVENSVLSKLSTIMFNQLGKLLGIVLDNAIEAAEIANKKQIGIEIYKNDNVIVFIISNTYKKIIADSFRMFTRSTKGENRGYGLLLTKTILKNNSRLKLETSITDSLYVQKIVIK